VQSAGTFLVRFSSNAQNPTWYTISKVSSDKKVRSIRIEHEPGGGVIPALLFLCGFFLYSLGDGSRVDCS
jgi:hypothetical protein